MINPKTANAGKFNFKIKITQTDLACREYLFGAGFDDGFGFGEDPAIFQNSSYISKLYFINNYTGGILTKDKIEDMPERYRMFVGLNNPTEAEIIRNFKKEMIVLANREEVGQNVFYSSLSANSNPAGYSSLANPAPVSSAPAILDNNDIFGDFKKVLEFGDYDAPELLNAVDWIANENENENESVDINEDYEDYENYKDGEEIKDILLLNNVFNSEMYKMSKVEYDFNVSGNISVSDGGLINMKYDESEITGLKNSYIQFLFKENDRDIVTIRRKHFFDSWFTLEKGKRVSIERRDQYSGTVTTTSTKELVNNISLEGGDMRIEYTTETDGIPTESVLYSIHAEPVK